MQICDGEDVRILPGAVSKDHVHMHIEYPPSKSISDMVKRLKGRTLSGAENFFESYDGQPR